MNVQDFFVTRYEVLYSFFIPHIFENLSHAQMRQ